ncbi:MAG: tetratricopeptide repeat protein [Rikenellaceae bacterium]|nr:tetratricopeptide repeat protein [Rikenellaceae bacterium]
MRKTIFLLAGAVMLAAGAMGQEMGQTVATKDHYTTAKQLYAAGRWSAAQAELATELQALGSNDPSRREEVEVLYALTVERLGQTDAGELLKGLLARYPHSLYASEVRFRAGSFAYDNGRYDEALALLGAVDERRLDKTELDEYRFKTAHSYFSTGDYESAVSYFEQVSPSSIYAPHAQYYTAYIDYQRGNHNEARKGFTQLADNTSYQRIVPYYLFQIEFVEGNWGYVVENGDRLIEGSAMPRRAELVRMVAEGWFHLEDYDKTLDYINTYRTLGGAMGREEYYLEGFSLYKEGQWRQAAYALSHATGADDRLSQNASYHLGDAYLRLGERERAMQSFSIASAAGYDEAIAEDALFNYGKLLYELGGGRFNEAVNILSRYLELYPRSTRAAEVREYLIAAYYNSHDYEAAYNAIMQFPDPDNNIRAALQKITYFRALELWQAGEEAEAERLLTTSATYRYNTKYTALAAFWQGEMLYAQGKYGEAIPKYKEYLRLSPTSEPENAMARYNLGYAYFNLQQWDEAMEWFADFLERHTQGDTYRADALNRSGDIHHARREYWKAIESFDKAAAIDSPERYYSAYQRAMMLGLVERPERKIESLSAIITAGEGGYVEDAMYELGRTYISRESYANGANALVRFIARYPNSRYYTAALADLGLAYLNMGEREKSMKYYKMIVDHAPRSREATDALAGIRGIYVDSNDVDGYFDYAKGVSVKSDVGEGMRDSLGFVAAEKVYLSGDAGAAISALKGYIAGNEQGRYLPTALHYLADLQYKEEQYGDAAQTYRTLAGATTEQRVVSRALDGWVASTIAGGDEQQIVAMADEASSLGGVPAASLRRAQFAKAGILARGGQTEQAMAIYKQLGDDVTTPEGAEAAYRVIEQLYGEGSFDEAELAVFALTEKNTPHTYWLGKAFLTLGDIFAGRGDAFQARATWQSIVDGYSPADDGIVAAARERIANLK